MLKDDNVNKPQLQWKLAHTVRSTSNQKTFCKGNQCCQEQSPISRTSPFTACTHNKETLGSKKKLFYSGTDSDGIFKFLTLTFVCFVQQKRLLMKNQRKRAKQQDNNNNKYWFHRLRNKTPPHRKNNSFTVWLIPIYSTNIS